VASKRQGFVAIVAVVLLSVASTALTLAQAGDTYVPTRQEVSASSDDDLDHDGIQDSFEDELMRRFAPIVLLHDQDENRPSSVDWYLNQGTTLRFNRKLSCVDHKWIDPYQIQYGSNLLGWEDHQVTAFCINWEWQTSGPWHRTSDFFIQIWPDSNWERTTCGDIASAIAYAHVTRAQEVDTYKVSYFFFYPYNGSLYYDGPGRDQKAGGAHEGDWEQIHVIVAPDPEGEWVIEKIAYAAHDGGDWYYPHEFTLSDGHPIVYSAWHSHASYPEGGQHNRVWPKADDYCCTLSDDNCIIWNTLWTGGGVRNIGEKDYPRPGMEWIQYSGRWGKVGAYGGDCRPGFCYSGPYGPAYGGGWVDPGAFAPEVIAWWGDQSADEGTPTAFYLGLFFDDPSRGPWTVTVDWGDGSTTGWSTDLRGWLPATLHTYANGPDMLEVAVRVQNNDGWWGEDFFEVTVNNVAPVVTAEGSATDENGWATVSGTITDPGAEDTFAMTIDWGEGSETYDYPAGTTTYSEQHQYLDDNPTGTPSDVYPVTVNVVDNDGGSGSASTSVTVNNVAPVVSLDSIHDELGAEIPGDVPVALVHLRIEVAGSFTDVGTQDTHTAVMDWGDGTAHDLGPVSGTTIDNYVYPNPGDYEIELTVTDDDTGASLAAAPITVVDAAGAIEIVAALLEAHSGSPDVADAIEKLRGENDGKAENGALDMLAKGNLNAALEKVKQALQEMAAAETADPDLDLTNSKGLLALAAKSVAVEAIAQAEAVATRPNDLRKIEQANDLVAQGDALLAAPEYVGGVTKYQEAVREVQGMLN
jgi:hypothetical protein